MLTFHSLFVNLTYFTVMAETATVVQLLLKILKYISGHYSTYLTMETTWVVFEDCKCLLLSEFTLIKA